MPAATHPLPGRGHLFLLSSCFFLSGLAGLIYQTAWAQQLALVFGTSELALATVLAAYMGGLALGAALAVRWLGRVRRPILIYGMLELGIALAALAVSAAIEAAGRLHVAVLGGAEMPTDAASAGSAAFYLATSFAILLVPTALMGATLPLLARHAVRGEAEIGPRIAVLYTANTVGAAAGALVTAFLLLPRLGLGQTILAGAAVNVLVFGAAVLLTRGVAPRAAAQLARPARAPRAHWILPVVAVSGAVSFTWEIVWTRLLTPLLGGSVYAFAVMLASFLVALAAGSALAAPLASSAERARRAFGGAQIAIAGLSLGAFAMADHLPAWLRQSAAAGPAAASGGSTLNTILSANLLSGSVASGALLLPGAVAIGATFPLAVRVLARDADDAASASARVFAWNTVGAIVGALATGYLVLPALGFAGTASAAAAVSLVLAAVVVLGIRPRLPLFGATAVAGLLALAMARPGTPWSVLRHSSLAARPVPGQVFHLGVGRSATVLLAEHHGAWRLISNGLPESSIESTAQHPGRHVVARWLALLPLAVRPEMRSLLVVGLGAGITVEDVPASVEAIHVVELEPEVVRANRLVADRRRQDPLADPRLRLHLGDARGALRLTRQRFDAVVSQPSHPWTAASNLYSREFFSLVRDRLTPDGVLVQWMALPFVDETLLRSLLATAADVFPYVELYQPRPESVLVLASGRPLAVESTAGRAVAAGRREWAQVGVLCREDVLAARVLDHEGVRGFLREGADRQVTLVTDARNLFRMRGPMVLKRPLGPVGVDHLLARFEPLEPSDDVYLVRRLIRQGATRRAWRLAGALEDPVERQTARGLAELAVGRRRQGEAGLRRALQLDPENEEALAALLMLYRPAIVGGQPVDLAQRGTPQLQAVVEGWRLAAAGDWRGARRLEKRLAALEPRHPLFAAAQRLRVRWRTESGEESLARETLGLLLPLLAPHPQPRDLLLRGRAGAVAGEAQIALAAVGETLALVQGAAAKRGVAQEARRILEALPVQQDLESWRQELLSYVR